MDELLKRVAKLKGMPASLVERSAQARAEKTGTTLEAVLMEWAGDADGADAGEQESSSHPVADVPSTELADAAAEDDDVALSAGEPSSGSTGDTAVVEITTDYLVAIAAEAKRMPPKLIRSSASARAEHSGSSLDEVLALWAGVDLQELRSSGPAPSASEEAQKGSTTESSSQPAESETKDSEEQQTKTSPQADTADSSSSITMEELLVLVAAAKGMPASLAKRSAEARAKSTGEPLESVLADWAGVDVATVVSDVEVSPAATQPAATAAAESDGEQTTDEATQSEVEVIEASPVDTGETDEDEPVGSEPSVTTSRYPRWLAAAFVLIPMLGIIYILTAPNGPDCGTAGQLLVDQESGEAVSCDGSSYPSSSVDFFADGEKIYAQCAACHSADGSGGAGPAFTGGAVLATFPSGQCGDHIAWVTIGTAGWPDPTYGATGKPVGGVGLMPGFGSQLSEEELASVALYERVQFGGEDLETAEIDCGLVGSQDGSSLEASGS